MHQKGTQYHCYCTGSIIVGRGRRINEGFLGVRGNIQIVAIKDMFVHFKCTTSELHKMYYHIDIYNANNRLLNLFFLLQEKPQATESEYTMNIYIYKQMKNEHLYVHLTLAAGY